MYFFNQFKENPYYYWGGVDSAVNRKLQLETRDDSVLFYSDEIEYQLQSGEEVIGGAFQPIISAPNIKGRSVPSEVVHGNFFYVVR